jgi:uncharacterized protein DUF4440
MADSDDERDIMQCDDRRFKAMVRGDLPALRMALSESLPYTRSSGVHETKAEFLYSLTRGQFSYKSIIPEARSRFPRPPLYARLGRGDRDGIWDRSTSAQNPTRADVGHQSQA